MQKQAEALTTTTRERLRELYASSRKMTAGVVFGTGNGMLQEEVRDEVRARELRKASTLNAAARKKKKDLWELSLEVESTRLGFASAEDVKESDLTEAMIRTLKNDQLKTLCKWKKRSNDAAMPTNKEKLAARLIETMGRSSPNASPYNSDDENEEFESFHQIPMKFLIMPQQTFVMPVLPNYSLINIHPIVPRRMSCWGGHYNRL